MDDKSILLHVCCAPDATHSVKVLREQYKFSYFSTTLTISPHKNAKIINGIGNDVAKLFGVTYIAENFKKNDGFKKSIEYSKELGLYRQNYCGCIYSKIEAENKRKIKYANVSNHNHSDYR